MVTAEPDPRITRTRQRAMASVLQLLAEGGFDGLSMEGIAQRSGVAKSTIYRHWNTLPQLVLDAFASINPTPPAVVSTGSLRDDLHAFLTQLAAGVTTGPWASLMAPLVAAAERDEQFRALIHDFVESRRRHLSNLFQAAIDRGDLPSDSDPDLLAGLIGGNLFYRRLISREPIDDKLIAQLTEVLIPRRQRHA
ncbi:TetR/AcrR family transcriptional regulator [Micromonospora arborensis]|uniref:TetR/AcrR family transcriptional regulator n=1 Tax=Micromonospora arborensis TaxID=2116518 RepID=UPI00340757FE